MNGVQKGMVFKVGNNLSTRKGENRETIVSWLGLSLLVGLAFILFSLFHQPMISQANEPTQEKHFMVIIGLGVTKRCKELIQHCQMKIG